LGYTPLPHIEPEIRKSAKKLGIKLSDRVVTVQHFFRSPIMPFRFRTECAHEGIKFMGAFKADVIVYDP